MTYKDNIKAILEANFIGFNEEYLDAVCEKICGIQAEKTYEDGLNDAWECARKIMLCETKGGFSTDKYTEIFGNIATFQALEILSASEAIAKIKEYEEHQKCKECKWNEYKDAYHPNGNPCDSCIDGKNFSSKAPNVAKACSILEDDCPYDIPCAECEVQCSIARARNKAKELKGDKE